MSDLIYIVNPETRLLSSIKPVKLSEIGMREVRDLEEWVKNYPDILGEELLVVTSEFSKFDKSSRRIDVLAVDKRKKVVVVELKLEAENTFADLQAVRYAAFCSTMTIDDIVQELANHKNVDINESARILKEFWGVDEFEELDDKPRIILAASSFDDQEITSTVLWLRSFDLDISCVELTPYKLDEISKLILVPKMIIPLKEAQEYQIRVQRKQTIQSKSRLKDTSFAVFWKKVSEEFNKMGSGLFIEKIANRYYQQIQTGIKNVHYEFLVRRGSSVEIAIHYEGSDKARNHEMLSKLLVDKDDITKGIEYVFSVGPAGNKYASAFFSIPFDGNLDSNELATACSGLMTQFIQRTLKRIEESATG